MQIQSFDWTVYITKELKKGFDHSSTHKPSTDRFQDKTRAKLNISKSNKELWYSVFSDLNNKSIKYGQLKPTSGKYWYLLLDYKLT
jgi:hypothetical protein